MTNFTLIQKPQESALPTIVIRPATKNDINRLSVMGTRWARDYNKAGDSSSMTTQKQWMRNLMCDEVLAKVLVAVQDGVTLGFALCTDWSDSERLIDVVYVDPKARSKGVGSMLYRACFERLNATAISITYGRLLKKLSYWKALGFKSVMPKLGDGYTLRSLCVVQLAPVTTSPLNAPLDSKAIRRYMASMHDTMLDMHCKAIVNA